MKGEGSASHLVELILDLTTNIEDRAVVVVNYILGTQRGMSCIPQIPTESPCQNKQTKNTTQILPGIKTSDLVTILPTNQRALHFRQRL